MQFKTYDLFISISLKIFHWFLKRDKYRSESGTLIVRRLHTSHWGSSNLGMCLGLESNWQPFSTQTMPNQLRHTFSDHRWPWVTENTESKTTKSGTEDKDTTLTSVLFILYFKSLKMKCFTESSTARYDVHWPLRGRGTWWVPAMRYWQQAAVETLPAPMGPTRMGPRQWRMWRWADSARPRWVWARAYRPADHPTDGDQQQIWITNSIPFNVMAGVGDTGTMIHS